MIPLCVQCSYVNHYHYNHQIHQLDKYCDNCDVFFCEKHMLRHQCPQWVFYIPVGHHYHDFVKCLQKNDLEGMIDHVIEKIIDPECGPMYVWRQMLFDKDDYRTDPRTSCFDLHIGEYTFDDRWCFIIQCQALESKNGPPPPFVKKRIDSAKNDLRSDIVRFKIREQLVEKYSIKSL